MAIAKCHFGICFQASSFAFTSLYLLVSRDTTFQPHAPIPADAGIPEYDMSIVNRDACFPALALVVHVKAGESSPSLLDLLNLLGCSRRGDWDLARIDLFLLLLTLEVWHVVIIRLFII
jgi:hypothetical protein